MVEAFHCGGRRGARLLHSASGECASGLEWASKMGIIETRRRTDNAFFIKAQQTEAEVDHAGVHKERDAVEGAAQV